MSIRAPSRRMTIRAGIVLALTLPAHGQCPEAARVNASDASIGDLFGWSVAVDADVAVVGAPGRNAQSGAAYVYRFDPGASHWLEEAVLTAPGGGPAEFGRSVAVGGDVILVGAPGAGAGSVWVYRYDPGSGQWLDEDVLAAADGQAADQFGWGADVDGDAVVVATYGPGTAYVFRFDAGAGQWLEEARLTASDGVPLRESVSISGDVVIAGTRTGFSSAFVYRYDPDADGSPWVEEARLEPWDIDYLDYFGNAVAVSGDRVIVGAGGDVPTFDAGAVYVYRYDPAASQWVHDGKLLAADGSHSDHFGYAVALDGNAAIVGELYDQVDGAEVGSARVYRRGPGGWVEQTLLTASDAGPGDQFARSLAVSGDVAIVGASAWLQDGGTGSTYVFPAGATDCNDNGIPDACEILAGTAPDEDGNGRPDECDGDPGQYIGPDGGSWFAPSHWNGGSVPDPSLPVTIPSRVIIDQAGAQAATVTLTSSGDLCFASGTLATTDLTVTTGGVLEGTGTIQADVVSGGAVDPGVLSIDGSYEQTAEGVLRIELGGSGDVLSVSGAATLGGRLITELLQPPEALVGQVFEIVTCGSRNGWFGQTSQPILPPPLGWQLEILPQAVREHFEAASCQLQKLVAPNADALDRRGSSIAVSGDLAAVGARSNTAEGPVNVYRFDPQTSRWWYEATLEPSDNPTGSPYGWAVATDGESVIIGDSAAFGNVHSAGAAYVFTYEPDSSTWVEQQKLIASDGDSYDYFGTSVAVDGDRLLIGAPNDDDLGPYSGATYVFERDPGTSQWTEQAKLLPSQTAYMPRFGDSVGLAGDVAVVGSPGPHDNSEPGSAHVFHRDAESGDWVLEGELRPSSSVGGDHFGSAVAIAGETIVIGTEIDIQSGPVGAESAFVFQYDPDLPGWREVNHLVAPDATHPNAFGQSVAVGAEFLAVGARYLSTVDAWAGAVYVYHFDPAAAAWIWRTKVVPVGLEYADGLGAGVAVSGTTLFAGAWGDNDAGPAAGAVYVLDVGGPCPGDVDGDGEVGVQDFLDLLSAWGPCPDPPEPCPADFDGDGAVGVVDFLALLAHWG